MGSVAEHVEEVWTEVRSTVEPSRLAELEAIVEAGLKTFVEVGRALLEIRDDHHYVNAGYKSFETYCRERWGMSKTHANRQIEAAEVVDLLTPLGVAPANEAQARELVPLLGDEPQRLETSSELQTTYGNAITAERIRSAVRGETPEPKVIELVDQDIFDPGTEALCPMCNGSGVVPIESLGGKVR